MIGVGQLMAGLGLDSSQFQAGIAQANAAMKSAEAASGTTTARISQQWIGVGRAFTTVGKRLTTNVTLPIAALAAVAGKSFAGFEASLSKIVGLVGVAEDQVNSWKKEILDMAPAVRKGPKELADAMFFITSAGLRGQNALEALRVSAQAASAGLGETKVVADLVTSAMNAYGAETLNAKQATDVLVAGVREGKAEAADLAASMGMVLPIASAMGARFDQVAAAQAAMTRTGTEARVAATQLKAIFSALLKPTDQAEDALHKMGTSSEELRNMIQQGGLLDALMKIRDATHKYGNTIAAEAFPNIRALLGVLDLMGKNSEDNIKIFKALENSTGSLGKAFFASSKTLQATWETAMVNLQTSMTELGDTLKDSIAPLIEGVGNAVANLSDWFQDLSDTQKQNIIRWAGIAAAAGPVLFIVGKLVTGVGSLIGMFGKLVVVIKGVTAFLVANPYTAVAGAVIVLALAVGRLIRKNRELTGSQKMLNDLSNDVSKGYAEQSAEVRMLTRYIEDENQSNKTRIAAIERLKTIMPDYNGELTEEGRLINHNKKSIDKYLKSLKKEIRLKIFKEKYIEIQRKIIEQEEILARKQDELTQATEEWHRGQREVTANIALKRIYDNWNEINTATENARIELEGYNDELSTLEQSMKNKRLSPFGDDGDGGGDVISARFNKIQKELDNVNEKTIVTLNILKEELSVLQEKRDEVSLSEIGNINEEIDLLKKKINYYESLGTVSKEILDHQKKAKGDAGLFDIDQPDTDNLWSMGFEMPEEEFPEESWIDNYIADMLRAIEASKSLALQNQLLVSGFQALSQAGTIVGNTFAAWMGWLAQTTSAIMDVIAQLRVLVVAEKGASLASVISEAAKLPFPENFIALGSGIAAVLAAFATIPAFAEGGLVHGETIAKVGEYPGARSNPEVIAPLDKLQSIMGTSGGGRWETASVRIGFDELEIAMKKIKDKNSSVYGL